MQLRCSSRKYVRYPASVQTDSGAGEGTLFDISQTGCRMQSNATLTPGSYLALHIKAPEIEAPLAVELSIVRWHKDNQFGIEFLRYAQGVREHFTDLVNGLPPDEVSAQLSCTEYTVAAASAA